MNKSSSATAANLSFLTCQLSSQTGVIVKWSLFLGLLVFITLYLLIGYTHAKKRIRKGLPPLAYHRVSASPEKKSCAVSSPGILTVLFSSFQSS